jgi:uncharacterized membrane protein
MTAADITLLDGLGLVWLVASWFGFEIWSRRRVRSVPSIISEIALYRRLWMERMILHENRQSDATILGNLLRYAIFFASTTIFILGGLVALLGTTQRVIEVVAQLPFAGPVPVWVWEVKALILIYIFVYAFFKFTWSAWQYNALSIIVGAAPPPGSPAAAVAAHVEIAARVATLGGDSFNHGMRAYYFSMAVMSWFLHPLALIVAASWVTLVLYHREFHSKTLDALRGRRAAG